MYCVLTELRCSHILCCDVAPQGHCFCLQLMSEWEVFWLLGELWSSILSSCLMEQEASVDNVKGSEGVGGCFCVRLGELE